MLLAMSNWASWKFLTEKYKKWIALGKCHVLNLQSFLGCSLTDDNKTWSLHHFKKHYIKFFMAIVLVARTLPFFFFENEHIFHNISHLMHCVLINSVKRREREIKQKDEHIFFNVWNNMKHTKKIKYGYHCSKFSSMTVLMY